MKRPALLIAALAAVAIAAGVIFAVLRVSQDAAEVQSPPAQNLAVTIGDQTFTLVNGTASRPAAPGSAGVETVRVVGEAINGDVDGDGKPEAALLLADDPGGSGTFYYAVLAVNDGNAWRATNTLPLGDRITPQGIEYSGGQFVYRFMERKPDEPTAAEPSVLNTVPIRFDAATGRISAWG